MITYQKQSGFSLVETLVAITILLIVVAGPMTLSTSTARSTNFSSEQVQAFFLAQEGAELMQAYRDDLLLERFPNIQAGWDDFSDESGSGELRECFSSDGCGLIVDINSSEAEINLFACDSGTRCQLFYDDAAGSVRSRFTHTDTGNETVFTRRITTQNISASEVEVTSTVTWQSGNLRESQSVSVVTYLFNIYENI